MSYIVLSLGGGEIVLALVVFLLLFGSNKLPELAKGVGKGLREFRKATDDIKREIDNHTGGIVQDIKESTDGIRKNITDLTTDISSDINKTTSEINQNLNSYTDDAPYNEREVYTDTYVASAHESPLQENPVSPEPVQNIEDLSKEILESSNNTNTETLAG